MFITNCVSSVTLVLLVFLTSGVYSDLRTCESNDWPRRESYCFERQFCCGIDNLSCCDSTGFVRYRSPMDVIFGIVTLIIIFVCCPWMCYRCCCRRTTNSGIVYSPAGTTTTSVSVTMPPHAVQQVPYPTVVPYPQQTPYPPQYATNPYYGAPPPAYGPPVQAGMQQSSGPPTAPPYIPM